MIAHWGCSFHVNLYVDNLSVIHEQMHWLVLISGHILADSGEGEQPLVPTCLGRLSNEFSGDRDPVILFPNLIFSISKYVTVDPGHFQVCSMYLTRSFQKKEANVESK